MRALLQDIPVAPWRAGPIVLTVAERLEWFHRALAGEADGIRFPKGYVEHFPMAARTTKDVL